MQVVLINGREVSSMTHDQVRTLIANNCEDEQEELGGDDSNDSDNDHGYECHDHEDD